jgi:putative isomerase
VLDHQRADGMIPDAIHDEGVVTHLTFPVEADVTKPPLLAWAAWKFYETHGDREFLDEIYEPVVRWNRWWFEHNDTDGDGLPEYQHPFSSGLDDSPLWDDGMPVTSPDLITYLVLQEEALSKMAGVIGLHDDATLWARRADGTGAAADRRGCGILRQPVSSGRTHRGPCASMCVTPFNLFPLLTGRMPAAINRRLLARLTDPAQFWPAYPVPTVSLQRPQVRSADRCGAARRGSISTSCSRRGFSASAKVLLPRSCAAARWR